MKWFQGSITEAVTASKLKKAIFVVFIEGNDEVSKSFTDIINSEEISTILESEKFVAIKLESGSENHKFFAQIYQLVPVPSLFFINNGIPIEIISTVTTVADLVLKINSILDSINKDSGEKSSTQEFTKPTASTDPSAESQNNISDKNQSLSNEVTSSSSQEHSVPVEDKVKRAKELVELQKKKRQEEEDRKQKERELQRRQVGRDVQKMKQEQHELELKLAQEERLKEKNADAAARERILRQIEEDKLERKKKFEAYSKSLAPKKNEVSTKPKTATLGDMSKARIQFKLPIGTPTSATFEATSNLSALRIYVIENIQLPFRKFKMASSFPRKDFTEEDNNKTLLELELVPSAVILILPISNASTTSVAKSTNATGMFSHFLWTLFSPVISMYNFIIGYFNRRPGDGENQNNERERSDNNTNPSIPQNFRRNLGATTKIRSRGNVHTLHSRDDDNDENNTWNGNSTQQM